MAYGIAVFPATIAGVALHSVDHPILHFLYDAHMVGKAVLGAGTALVVPIKVVQEKASGFKCANGYVSGPLCGPRGNA